ncbi:LysR family transcriptional regulator [Dactylosporangium sp. NPDC006015]|uniref:LysR family transcriptional regulator n=1 Tax=unclassified Dactylosporangium TaxID=2621675 RepID=UPI0033AA618A
MHLAQLRAFVAVLDDGSFSGAAATLGISQSAVSHTIATLERTLGHPVLIRQGGVRATAFGAAIAGHARAAVVAAAAIGMLAAQRDGRPAGSIKLAAPPTVCQGLMPGLLARWRDELPGVDVALFEGEDDEVAEWLADHTVDLAVVVDPPPGPGHVLAEDTFHAVLRRDHPLAGEHAVGVADLQDDAFLLSRGGCERHVREAHRRSGVPFAPTHQVRELGTLFAMVRAGIGVSIVPGLAAAMLDPRLVLVPLRPVLARRLVLRGAIDRLWHPAVTALVEHAAA